MFAILWILLMDAANSIMNPDEASVLAHQPIRGASYVAAKLTHILVAVPVTALFWFWHRQQCWLLWPMPLLTSAWDAQIFADFGAL